MKTSKLVKSIKKVIHYAYLTYQRLFPINRGKYRLGVMIDKLIGKVEYSVGNVRLLLSPVSLIDKKLITGEGHDENVIATIREALQNGGNFIDVGANIGYMSLVAAKQIENRGFVYSFEPSPREFSRLLDNIVLNKLDNIFPIAKGIGKEYQLDSLYLCNMGNHGMNSRHLEHVGSQKVEVEFASVKSQVPEIELRKVRCVKIDVEGDEYSVLEGFADVMELLQQCVFIVEITKSYLDKAGKKPEDIYSFFKYYSFLPTLSSGSKPLYESSEQYDEIFSYDPRQE